LGVDDTSTANLEMTSKLEAKDAYEFGFAHGRKSILAKQSLLKNLAEIEL